MPRIKVNEEDGEAGAKHTGKRADVDARPISVASGPVGFAEETGVVKKQSDRIEVENGVYVIKTMLPSESGWDYHADNESGQDKTFKITLRSVTNVNIVPHGEAKIVDKACVILLPASAKDVHVLTLTKQDPKAGTCTNVGYEVE
eukprot:NODE_10558_length_507_cov_9.502604_g9910_i0.p1 GENE.NODE_10558_length_507_cov_9.502604_g9910_i0~~NODE_10558_length_507_cov_9.502604_g9910_i0.p1  ORF type:complete len:159 (+),score=19.03 NODE_10558_length_507_cov_9.502604_g9910_i0:45-479(+)